MRLGRIQCSVLDCPGLGHRRKGAVSDALAGVPDNVALPGKRVQAVACHAFREMSHPEFRRDGVGLGEAPGRSA